MIFKYREVITSVHSKTPVPNGYWRSGKENSAPIVIGGIQISRVTLPKVKTGDIRPGTLNSIRKQLLLCRSQFIDFIKCSMTNTDYINKMKTKHPSIF